MRDRKKFGVCAHTDFTMVALCLVIDHFWKGEVTFVESPGRNSDYFFA